MKGLKASLATFSLIGIGFLCGMPGWAQSKVLVEPDTLTVTSVRPGVFQRLWVSTGWGEYTPEARTLVLRSTEQITDVQAYSFDLYNGDRDRVFARKFITLPADFDSITANGLRTLPVLFDLSSAPSGEFQGFLLISYSDGEVSIPITIRVKDPWPLPLLLLSLGIVLGTTTSSYTRWGRGVDQLTVSMESLRTQLNADKAIPDAFSSKISAQLFDAGDFRRSKQIGDAQQSVVSAGALWRKWARERTDWITKIEDIQALDERLQEAIEKATEKSDDAAVRYRQALQKRLKDTLAKLADLSGVDALSSQVDEYTQQLTAYENLRRRFVLLEDKLKQIESDTEIPKAKEKLTMLKANTEKIFQKISEHVPTDTFESSKISALETELFQAMDALNDIKEIKAESAKEPASRGGFTIGEPKSVISEGDAFTIITEVASSNEIKSVELEPVESQIKPNPVESKPGEGKSTGVPTSSADENLILKLLGMGGLKANQRLQLFSTTGYLTTIAFLAGTGFNQLYLEKSTFGESGPVDYFSLVAWGFGAEATRNAITNVLRRTDENKA